MTYKDPDKQREYSRNWVAHRKAAWFENKFCVVCRSTENLNLDHIDPKLKISHSIWSWSKEKFDKEVQKCQVLCFTCHKDKTNKQNNWGQYSPHGSSRYKWGCRCEVCRTAQRDRMRRRREKLKIT